MYILSQFEMNFGQSILQAQKQFAVVSGGKSAHSHANLHKLIVISGWLLGP